MKNVCKKVFRTKEEWLEAKKSTIGGSEIAAICGKSKWMTPSDLFNKLVYGKTSSFKGNSRTEEGIKAEEHIRELFALDSKQFKIKAPPKKGYWLFFRKDKSYISCTPDALATHIDTNKLWGIEIKDVELRKSKDIEEWESGTLPDQYYYQCLHYFINFEEMEGVVLVAHLKYFSFNHSTSTWEFSHAEDRPYYIYRTEVETHIRYLENKVTDFFENNVLKRKRPKTIVNL